MRYLGAGHGPAGNMYVSEANGNGTFTSSGALHLSATTWLKVGGFNEQSCVTWGVIVLMYVIIVQGTVGPRATVIRVKDKCVCVFVYSPQRRVASCIHLRNSFRSTWAWGFPSTDRVVSSAEKVVKEGRSSSRVSRWNLSVHLSSTTFVAGHCYMMWSSSPRIRVPEARQYGQTQSL